MCALCTLVLGAAVGVDDQGLEKCLKEENKMSSCSPPTKSKCYLIEHFGTSDYAGNGLYCDFGGKKPHFVRVSKVGQQRYEVMVSSKHKKGEAGGEVVNSWMLMKVTRSMTSRGDWVPMPIYQAIGLAEGGLPLEGWNGVKRKRSKGDDNTPNFDGEYSYDHEDPVLRVSEVTLGAQEEVLVWNRQVVEGLEFVGEKSCVAEVCGKVGAGGSGGSGGVIAAAQHAEAGLDNELAGKFYGEAVDMMLQKVEGMKMVPRFERWQIAETYGDAGRMMGRQGLFEEAVEKITKGLSYASVDVQRRALYMDLGDLYLAMGKIDEAKQSYAGAKKAVKTKGGMADVAGYGVRVGKGSVGEGLLQVLGDFYGKVRGMLILGVDAGEDWEEALDIWTSLTGKVGEAVVCGEEEEVIDGELFGKFCKKYARFNIVGGMAREQDGGGLKEEL